jgi:GAF domain-containing protein/HAMP domain-containing protein
MIMETKKKNSRPARSLAVTFATAFLTLSAVILLASGGFQLFFNVQAQQQALSSLQQNIAQGAANTVNNFIEENFSVLSTSVQVAHPNTLPLANQNQFMVSLLAAQPGFRQYAIFDAQNNESSMASRTQVAQTKKIISYVTSDILAQTQKGKRYISSVYFDVVNNEPLVLMAVPIINVLGEYQGAFVGELNLISMWNQVNQIKVGNTGYAYVVDSKGKLLAYKDTARAFKGEDTSNIKTVNEFISNPGSIPAKRVNLYTGINGSLVVGTFVPLGSPNWAVVTELPWQEAYRQSIQLGAVSVGIILVLAALAIVVGILVPRRLSIPLIELTSTATAISAGNLKQRAKVRGGLEIEALASAFNNMGDQLQGLIDGLEERISERTQVLEKRSLELQNAAQIVREVSTIQDTNILLDRVSHLIKARFGYYHTGIFLIDDNEEYAVLKASGGDAGQLMLASKHKLKIGETGIVGYVAKTGEPRISLDVGTDTVHHQNILLPYTRSEMALPLKVGNHVIGVLDIQSDKTNAFDQSNISVMQIVTDQISIGFERAQLLQGMRKNESELQLTLKEDTSRSWRNYLEQKRGFVGYQFDGVTIASLTGLSTDNLKEMQKIERVANADDEIGIYDNELAVPIQLRGQTLGTLNLHFQSPKISQETSRLVEEAADRLALALENARLVQDAQRLAMRERQINLISTQAQQSTDLDTLLKNTVRELGNTLGMPKTFIQIGLADSGSSKDLISK